MAQILEYKCPCCGGAISFDSSLQKLKCPYCDTEFDVDTLHSYNDAAAQDGDDIHWGNTPGETYSQADENGLVTFVCRSCGGEIVGDANTAATSCPFCGNPVVMTQQVSGTLKPDLVIPFQLDKNAAKEAYKNHLKGKRLVPKLFGTENHIDEIKGVYIPVWLYDADVYGNMRYRATRTRSWSDRRYNYVETSYFSVLRGGTLTFDAVPVDGATKMPDEIMESLEPFDVSRAVSFNTAYLAGYFADKYDVSAEESQNRANERIRTSTSDVFASTVQGYATVQPEAANISLTGGRVRYALYPVWLLTTSWNGGTYTFAMNGQTGRLVGDLPMDKGTYWKWFGILGLIGAAVSYGVFNLVHFLM